MVVSKCQRVPLRRECRTWNCYYSLHYLAWHCFLGLVCALSHDTTLSVLWHIVGVDGDWALSKILAGNVFYIHDFVLSVLQSPQLLISRLLKI